MASRQMGGASEMVDSAAIRTALNVNRNESDRDLRFWERPNCGATSTPSG